VASSAGAKEGQSNGNGHGAKPSSEDIEGIRQSLDSLRQRVEGLAPLSA